MLYKFSELKYNGFTTHAAFAHTDVGKFKRSIL